jgi:CubicO group peptidase (beta-lactamase class C family)
MREQILIMALAFTAVAYTAAPSLAQDRKENDVVISNSNVKAAAAYSRERRGSALLILQGDKTVYEDYSFGQSAGFPWLIASGTKSFAGVMLAAAIEDKLISGFDEKVADTITEWKRDPRLSKVTMRQLLSLTSGIAAGTLGEVPTYREAIRYTALHEPGKQFAYGPVPFQVFGEVMTRKLQPKKETVMAYIDRRIFDPIGMKAYGWRRLEGQPLLPQGATLTAREWAKFGRLLAAGGKWNGKQILRKDLVQELMIGTSANPAYGITFWLDRDGIGSSGDRRMRLFAGKNGEKKDGPSDIFMAAGAGNQRLYVIPSKELVIVRFGIFGGFEDRKFLELLLEN